MHAVKPVKSLIPKEGRFTGARKASQRSWRNTLMGGSFAIAIGLCAPVAQAAVILIGPVEHQPSGIGTVSTILSLQAQGNATDETGRVSFNGTNSVATSLPNPAGAAQPGVDTTVIIGGANNQARTFAELGLTQASDLRVIFNINEPPTAADVLLRSLIFNVYDASGTNVFTSSLAAPLTLTQVASGIGMAGYMFGLSAADAVLLQSIFSPTLRLGLEASISNAQGGFETFFAGAAQAMQAPGAKVPEPGTLALMGLALAGFAVVRRRKRT